MSEDDLRPLIPNLNVDDELKIVKEDNLPKGAREIFILPLKGLAVRVYEISGVRNIVYAVLITLSALEGLRFQIPLMTDLPTIVMEFEDRASWLSNIVNNSDRIDIPRYFQFSYPANPSPTDEVHTPIRTTIVAPITASNVFEQHFHQQITNPSGTTDNNNKI